MNVHSTPSFRIISLVPSQTQLLVDLGLEESIVGITKFCIHPSHLRRTKTIVGGTKQCHFEKIRALSPTHILCNKEENTKVIVETSKTIAHTHVAEIFTIQDTLALIKNYGTLFSKEREANLLRTKIKQKLTDFTSFIKEKPQLKVAYFIWRKPWMVAANNTYINHLLELNNFTNIYDHKDRYPEIDIQDLKDKESPDVVFLSSEPYPFKEEHISEFDSKKHQAKICFVDGEMFSWHGSKLVEAFDYFKKLRNDI